MVTPREVVIDPVETLIFSYEIGTVNSDKIRSRITLLIR